LNFNKTPFVVNTADTTFSLYSSDTALNAGTLLTNAQVTVYQVFLDQLPVSNGGVVLPILDLSTVYELKTTNGSALVVGQDFPVPYSNFRQFLSTILLYNHDASANAGRAAGTDVNYFALQSANFTNIWK